MAKSAAAALAQWMKRRRQWWRFGGRSLLFCHVVSHEINHEKIHLICFQLKAAGRLAALRWYSGQMEERVGKLEAILWLTVWLFFGTQIECEWGKVIWNSFTFSWYIASFHEQTLHDAERYWTRLLGERKVFQCCWCFHFPTVFAFVGAQTHTRIPDPHHHHNGTSNQQLYFMYCWLRHQDNIRKVSNVYKETLLSFTISLG